MFYKALLAVQLLLFLLPLAQLVSCDGNNGNSAEKICIDLQAGRDEIRLLGILRTRLLLITEAKFVFELPLEALDNSAKQLHLIDGKGLHEKWPQMERVLTAGSVALSVSDLQKEFIVVVASDGSSVAFDLDSHQLKPMQVHRQWAASTKLLSTGEPLTFYAMDHDGNSHLGAHYEFQGSATLPGAENVTQLWSGRLCVEEGNGRRIVLHHHECPTLQPSLNITGGFVTEQQVYLFSGNRSVLILDRSPNVHHELGRLAQVIPLADFFVCSRKDTHPLSRSMGNLGDDDSGGGGLSGGGLTAVIIVVVIILLAGGGVAVYCLFCKGKMKMPWKKSTKSGKSKKSREYRPTTEESIRECKRAAVFG